MFLSCTSTYFVSTRVYFPNVLFFFQLDPIKVYYTFNFNKILKYFYSVLHISLRPRSYFTVVSILGILQLGFGTSQTLQTLTLPSDRGSGPAHSSLYISLCPLYRPLFTAQFPQVDIWSNQCYGLASSWPGSYVQVWCRSRSGSVQSEFYVYFYSQAVPVQFFLSFSLAS